MPKWKALAIFSSDALSSVGYGPEQIALVLAISGLVAYGYYPYAFLTVLILLAIVTASYTQVTRANPGGGGSYSVAKKNLGEYPSLVAGAALFADGGRKHMCGHTSAGIRISGTAGAGSQH
ncbi:hypothetical protein [Anaerospora hongkongensis]|uniref:hypothetical protein n=1 Tax=Anaerospora hongkongensis TaxID=244830 RepID=UPI00406A57A8